MSGPASEELQYKLLSSLSEGDVFEHGALFVFDPEQLVWRCEETTVVDTADGPLRHITLHVYWRGVMVRPLTVWLDEQTQRVRWVTRVN